MKANLYRTECNGRSKYFTDIKAAQMHFNVCAIKRKSVELWVMGAGVQWLFDSVYFH